MLQGCGTPLRLNYSGASSRLREINFFSFDLQPKIRYFIRSALHLNRQVNIYRMAAVSFRRNEMDAEAFAVLWGVDYGPQGLRLKHIRQALNEVQRTLSCPSSVFTSSALSSTSS